MEKSSWNLDNIHVQFLGKWCCIVDSSWAIQSKRKQVKQRYHCYNFYFLYCLYFCIYLLHSNSRWSCLRCMDGLNPQEFWVGFRRLIKCRLGRYSRAFLSDQFAVSWRLIRSTMLRSDKQKGKNLFRTTHVQLKWLQTTERVKRELRRDLDKILQMLKSDIAREK